MPSDSQSPQKSQSRRFHYHVTVSTIYGAPFLSSSFFGLAVIPVIHRGFWQNPLGMELDPRREPLPCPGNGIFVAAFFECRCGTGARASPLPCLQATARLAPIPSRPVPLPRPPARTGPGAREREGKMHGNARVQVIVSHICIYSNKLTVSRQKTSCCCGSPVRTSEHRLSMSRNIRTDSKASFETQRARSDLERISLLGTVSSWRGAPCSPGRYLSTKRPSPSKLNRR
jgi:hypothetical protein